MNLLKPLSPDYGLSILGPSFSGSLPSLDQALDADVHRQIPVSVSSGTVSSETSYLWFRHRVEMNHSGSFETAMEGDPLKTQRFLDYLHHQDYRLERIAVISEDETAFGTTENVKQEDETKAGQRNVGDERTKGSEPPRCCDHGDERKNPIYLYYPRDIATLRSAYEKQSIFSAGKPPSSGNTSTTLRGDLSEPNSSDHDTVRSYGGELTPLAQESVLLGITNIL